MQRRAHVEEGHVNNERWLLTYADLITLLLVFFVILYSISKADEKKFARISAALQHAFSVNVLQGSDPTAVGGENGPLDAGTSILDEYAAMRLEIQNIANQMGLQRDITVNLRKDGLAISVSGSLLFDSGRADLRPESMAALDKLAEELRRLPNDIRVEGHTDNVPVNSDLFPTNWELSAARATAVTRYLSELDGIPPRRLSAQGYGEFRPVAGNDTRDNRARNRRVELLIVNAN